MGFAVSKFASAGTVLTPYDDSSNKGLIIGLCVGAAVLILMAAAGGFYYRHKKMTAEKSEQLITSGVYDSERPPVEQAVEN